jgi:hypothetical protein
MYVSTNVCFTPAATQARYKVRENINFRMFRVNKHKAQLLNFRMQEIMTNSENIEKNGIFSINIKNFDKLKNKV